jgi:hypothetical protein
MAKIMVVNGIRCVPENRNALTADKRAEEATASRLRSIERAELTLTVLNLKAAELLKSL